MRYRIRYSAEAKKAIQRLLGSYCQQVCRAIEHLADNPRPSAARELSGELEGLYKIRLGSWRIIYMPNDEASILLIIDLANEMIQRTRTSISDQRNSPLVAAPC